MKHFHGNHFYSWAIFIRMEAEIKVDYNTYELHEHDDFTFLKHFFCLRKCSTTIQVFYHFIIQRFFFRCWLEEQKFSPTANINIKSFIHQVNGLKVNLVSFISNNRITFLFFH